MVGDNHWNKSAETAAVWAFITLFTIAPILLLMGLWLTNPSFRDMIKCFINN